MSSRIKSVWLDVFPYYKNSAYPLCVIFRFRRRGERLIYPDVEINFGKGVEPKWCNEVREVPFVCSLPLEDSEQQYCDECRPYLYLHGIRRCADKTLDMEILLEVTKEDFNVPPCLIEVAIVPAESFMLLVSSTIVKWCSALYTAILRIFLGYCPDVPFPVSRTTSSMSTSWWVLSGKSRSSMRS